MNEETLFESLNWLDRRIVATWESDTETAESIRDYLSSVLEDLNSND